jgi:hypothetical protein
MKNSMMLFCLFLSSATPALADTLPVSLAQTMDAMNSDKNSIKFYIANPAKPNVSNAQAIADAKDLLTLIQHAQTFTPDGVTKPQDEAAFVSQLGAVADTVQKVLVDLQATPPNLVDATKEMAISGQMEDAGHDRFNP